MSSATKHHDSIIKPMEILTADELRKRLHTTHVDEAKQKLIMYRKTHDEYLKQQADFYKLSKREQRKKVNIRPILQSKEAILRTECVKLFEEIMQEIRCKGEFYRVYYEEDYKEGVFEEMKDIMRNLGYRYNIREDLVEEDAQTYNSFGSFHYTKSYTKYTLIVSL